MSCQDLRSAMPEHLSAIHTWAKTRPGHARIDR